MIQDRTPDQLKLNFALWTRQAVSELIEAVYGVRLTVRNTGKYLKRWGFTPQKTWFPGSTVCVDSAVTLPTTRLVDTFQGLGQVTRRTRASPAGM